MGPSKLRELARRPEAAKTRNHATEGQPFYLYLFCLKVEVVRLCTGTASEIELPKYSTEEIV